MSIFVTPCQTQFFTAEQLNKNLKVGMKNANEKNEYNSMYKDVVFAGY
jgi:hypothetical protein